MRPSIQMYGGVHNNPGSRQRFIEELAKQPTPPHFVAVEWEQAVFERVAAWRPWIAEALRSRWDFLTREDCHELSLALAWEGDAYAEHFPGANLLWLENGFQEAELQRRCGMDAEKFPERCASSLLWFLSNPCYPTMSESLANIAPRQSRGRRKISSTACG